MSVFLNRAQQELVAQSLAPDGQIIIVGDENQAIYGFSGADAQSFQNMINRFSAKRMPLSICYRCPTSVLSYARAIVPGIKAAPNAEKGTVLTHISKDKIAETLKPGDMVLSRTNAPLIAMYFKLIGLEKPAQIIGNDIHGKLMGVVDRIDSQNFFANFKEEFMDAIESHVDSMTAIYKKQEYGQRKIDALDDVAECLITCHDAFKVDTIAAYKAKLKALFPTSSTDDNNREKQRKNFINLSSVHRAKGLEAECVVVIEPEKMPLKYQNQKPWELGQEWNIAYVAITRSQNELIFCGKPPVEIGIPKPKPASDKLTLEKMLDEIKHKHHGYDILREEQW